MVEKEHWCHTFSMCVVVIGTCEFEDDNEEDPEVVEAAWEEEEGSARGAVEAVGWNEGQSL